MKSDKNYPEYVVPVKRTTQMPSGSALFEPKNAWIVGGSVFPTRHEIEILGPDDPNQPKLGWKVEECVRFKQGFFSRILSWFEEFYERVRPK